MRTKAALLFGMFTFGSSLCAAAEQLPDAELSNIRINFEYGKYEEALRRAKARIDRGQISEDDLIELHKYAALSGFNLHRRDDAERHFTALLKLNPDYNLDPFVVAPAAIAYLEEVRKRLGPALDVIRERRVERLQRAAEERARSAREAEEQRRRFENLTHRVTVKTVENRVFWLNFLPFGVGQFQQERNTLGVVLLTSQAVMGVTSVLSFVAAGTLTKEFTVTDPANPGEVTTVRGVPSDPAVQSQLQTWRLAQLLTGAAFYALYVYGVADAIYKHQDQVVSTRVEEPRAIAPYITPHPGGLGAGLSVRF